MRREPEEPEDVAELGPVQVHVIPQLEPANHTAAGRAWGRPYTEFVRVELRAVPDCPHLAATRRRLLACLAEAGWPPDIDERLGDFRSPSVLVDGVDVTGADPDAPAACVLHPPTQEQILTALRGHGSHRRPA
jgi:hypothetical protein